MVEVELEKLPACATWGTSAIRIFVTVARRES